MANRFFPVKEPRAGMPFSFKGLARGIRKMANALDRLEVVGGHVEWNVFDEPKIIIDPASTMEPSTGGGGSGGGSTPLAPTSVMAKVLGGSTEEGFSIQCYPNYPHDDGRFNAVAFVPSVAFGTLSLSGEWTGKWVIAHYVGLRAIGGA